MSTYSRAEVREFGRIHDFHDPASELNKLEMIYAAARRPLPECPHCRVDYRVRPMAGTAWGLEHFHEPTCPEAD